MTVPVAGVTTITELLPPAVTHTWLPSVDTAIDSGVIDVGKAMLFTTVPLAVSMSASDVGDAPYAVAPSGENAITLTPPIGRVPVTMFCVVSMAVSD
jgi:hypothetical protein